MRRSSFVGGLLIGAALGAMAALLMVPETRREMAAEAGERLRGMWRRGRRWASRAMAE